MKSKHEMWPWKVSMKCDHEKWQWKVTIKCEGSDKRYVQSYLCGMEGPCSQLDLHFKGHSHLKPHRDIDQWLPSKLTYISQFVGSGFQVGLETRSPAQAQKHWAWVNAFNTQSIWRCLSLSSKYRLKFHLETGARSSIHCSWEVTVIKCSYGKK